jgi:hypothetical protein
MVIKMRHISCIIFTIQDISGGYYGYKNMFSIKRREAKEGEVACKGVFEAEK